MTLNFTLTAYCSECNTDFAEADSDNYDELTQQMETRAEYLYAEHIRKDKCR